MLRASTSAGTAVTVAAYRPSPGGGSRSAVGRARFTSSGGVGRTWPNPSDRNPHYYPGGNVAGRPVPAGWYSEPWWKPALVAGAWGLGSMLLFSAMFSGMSGVAYADGYADGMAADGTDGMDGGDAGADTGGDWGGDYGGSDFGGSDFGGGDFF